jgi:hypothetical protein
MISFISILLGGGFNPSKTVFSVPFDSTKGVNNWYYLFSLVVLLVLVLAVLKAFWDDKEWRQKHFGRWLKIKK